ncbi:AcrR family transcriptional regulator [Paenibacillus sp. RC254]|uniref:TetR/AcrR family transcriptional regulator n=1 Tax=unclassified Paenibacillus TaxID=185978 RepID=UPI0024BBC477|nr:TetR/AcrR family transcriptional regulator [Paenibacillus sp. RC334]
MTDDSKVIDKKNETCIKLSMKLAPYVKKHGFQTLRMDEIAKIMDISRATLYKYFSTKEEVIEYVVNNFIEFINELVMDSLDTDQLYGTRFQQLFEKSILLAVYITDIFLNELEHIYPEKYDRLRIALQFQEQQLLEFYEEGIQKGVFNQVNGKLLILQDELLRSMTDIKYLMLNHLTIYQVLYDFYQLKKVQLFKPEKIQSVDDASMIPRIEHLAQKISKELY